MDYSFFLRLCVLCSLQLVTACTSLLFSEYGPDHQSLQDFEKRVETAFRLQNNMTSEVMLLQDVDLDKKNQDAIFQAEQNMQQKCSHLNEYASRDIDGLSKSLLLQRRVEKSVVACENAAQLLKTLLNASQR